MTEKKKKRFDLTREELEKKIAKLIGKEQEATKAMEIAKIVAITEFEASKE